MSSCSGLDTIRVGEHERTSGYKESPYAHITQSGTLLFLAIFSPLIKVGIISHTFDTNKGCFTTPCFVGMKE